MEKKCVCPVENKSIREDGSIAKTASIVGLIGFPRESSNYGASKGGVIAFTETLPVEWAKELMPPLLANFELY